jgi:hypothetical protein
VLENLVFAVLAVVIAVIALGAANGDVNQVCLRLGVSGLVATVFEPDYGEGMVDTESERFQENKEKNFMRIAVTIEKTAVGVVAWITCGQMHQPLQVSWPAEHCATAV